MITAGFTLIGRGNWSGGETYLRNMLGVISGELAGKMQAKLFLTPEQAEKIGASMDAFLAAPPIVDEKVAGFGRGRNAIRALVGGSDADAAQMMTREGVDVVFEPAQFYGNRFPISVVSWIPDFQHRHLPHLFSRAAWWRRDLGFRLQTSGRRIILLSSGDAGKDCETYYPASRGKTAVVRFAIDLDPAPHIARQAEVIARYELPQRYFYLPNQFWSHKNHGLVVEALAHQIDALVKRVDRAHEILRGLLDSVTERVEFRLFHTRLPQEAYAQPLRMQRAQMQRHPAERQACLVQLAAQEKEDIVHILDMTRADQQPVENGAAPFLPLSGLYVVRKCLLCVHGRGLLQKAPVAAKTPTDRKPLSSPLKQDDILRFDASPAEFFRKC